jgi:CRISPR-associated protein Cas1
MKKTYYLFNPGTMERKDNTLKFKPVEYDENGNEHVQGYLHVNEIYLPKFDGNKSYLFVAIDRANRLTWRSEKRTAHINPFLGRRKMIYLKT